MKRCFSVLLTVLISTSVAQAAKFIEKLPVYGIVKPGAITTLLAVNHGMVIRVVKDVGDPVEMGETLLAVVENYPQFKAYQHFLNLQR